jgi:hypothetical protein
MEHFTLIRCLRQPCDLDLLARIGVRVPDRVDAADIDRGDEEASCRASSPRGCAREGAGRPDGLVLRRTRL